MNAEIKNYAGSLYEKASIESVKQLHEERASYLAEMAKRSTGFSLLGGSEIGAIVQQHVRHIERCMSARLESYRQAFIEANQTPTDDDFNTILHEAQRTREQAAKNSAAAVRNFVASRGGAHLPPGAQASAINQIMSDSGHGHDRVLHEWKIWRDKTRLSKPVVVAPTLPQDHSIKEEVTTQSVNEAPWYESNLLWGPLSLGLGLVFIVLPSLVHDLRWLLWLAALCFAVASWATLRRINRSHVRWSLILLAVLMIGVGLYALNMRLAHSEAQAVPQAKVQDESKPNVIPRTVSEAEKQAVVESTNPKAPPKKSVTKKKSSEKVEIPPVTINNSPGSAVSVGQQGGVTAGTYNNYAPVARHVSPPLAVALQEVASKFPDSSAQWFSVTVLGDAEAKQFASEVEQIFRSQKKSDGLTTWWDGPLWKGTYVLYSTTEAHIQEAEKIRSAFERNGIVVHFGRDKTIPADSVLLYVGLQE